MIIHSTLPLEIAFTSIIIFYDFDSLEREVEHILYLPPWMREQRQRNKIGVSLI